MKIKYLKEMHNAKAGDVLEVTDIEANVLIKTGVAEEFKTPKPKVKPKATTEKQD